jgi:hypothetical protein
MTLAAQIEAVQPDVYNKLLSEPYFNNIAIFLIREKRFQSEINAALSGMAGRNGYGGATIEVLFPTLQQPLEETPGPICTLQQKFIVKTQENINQGPGGTGLSVEQIAVNLAQTFQLFFLGGPLQGFYVAGNFYEYVVFDAEAPFLGVAVTLHATFALTALTRTLGPQPSTADSNGNVLVTLTDQQPGGGSTIYYSTDGSFPGYGNTSAGNPTGLGTAQVYSTPFSVPSGTTIRTASYNGTLQGSMVDTFVVT